MRKNGPLKDKSQETGIKTRSSPGDESSRIDTQEKAGLSRCVWKKRGLFIAKGMKELTSCL